MLAGASFDNFSRSSDFQNRLAPPIQSINAVTCHYCHKFRDEVIQCGNRITDESKVAFQQISAILFDHNINKSSQYVHRNHQPQPNWNS